MYFILYNPYGCHYQLHKEVIMCFCNVIILPYRQLFEASYIKFWCWLLCSLWYMFHLEPMSSSSNGTFSFCKSKVVEGEDLSFRIIGCVCNLAIKKRKVLSGYLCSSIGNYYILKKLIWWELEYAWSMFSWIHCWFSSSGY